MDTNFAFLKDFFEKINFEKKKSAEDIFFLICPACRVKSYAELILAIKKKKIFN